MKVLGYISKSVKILFKGGVAIEKFMEKIHLIGKIFAFIAITLSLFQKLNSIFGFIDLDKVKNSKKDNRDTKENSED